MLNLDLSGPLGYRWGYAVGSFLVLVGSTGIVAMVGSLMTMLTFTVNNSAHAWMAFGMAVWSAICLFIAVTGVLIFKKTVLGWRALIVTLVFLGTACLGISIYLCTQWLLFTDSPDVPDKGLMLLSLVLSPSCFAIAWMQHRYWHKRRRVGVAAY